MLGIATEKSITQNTILVELSIFKMKVQNLICEHFKC